VESNELTVQEALLLYSMMALSARFSNSPYFSSISPPKRDAAFASHASLLYQQATSLEELEPSCSLLLLQGCTLFAIYQLTCQPSTKTWVTVGFGCRLALELGLNRVDADIVSNKNRAVLTPEEWSFREEQRCAWWLIWELDVFSSTLLRRPYAMDRGHMWVLLPVSDFAWFGDHPIHSNPIHPDPSHAWESLRDCPNQDERAWFLVCSFLMATAHDLSQRPNTGEYDLQEFIITLDCFSLLLPECFQLQELCFDEDNFARANWVIETHIMLHTYISWLSNTLSLADESQQLSSFASAKSSIEESIRHRQWTVIPGRILP
jgi:hypothetical protein